MAQAPRIEFRVPADIEAGVYSNVLSVWHTPYEFTLDFSSLQPPGTAEQPVATSLVVARVKIPPALVFDVIRALNENMTKYEEVFGEIQRPEAQGGPHAQPSG
jgi:hypothetical protein